jgi:hypothetical protein
MKPSRCGGASSLYVARVDRAFGRSVLLIDFDYDPSTVVGQVYRLINFNILHRERSVYVVLPAWVRYKLSSSVRRYNIWFKLDHDPSWGRGLVGLKIYLAKNATAAAQDATE